MGTQPERQRGKGRLIYLKMREIAGHHDREKNNTISLRWDGPEKVREGEGNNERRGNPS